jgi:hypothetical protein
VWVTDVNGPLSPGGLPLDVLSFREYAQRQGSAVPADGVYSREGDDGYFLLELRPKRVVKVPAGQMYWTRVGRNAMDDDDLEPEVPSQVHFAFECGG